MYGGVPISYLFLLKGKVFWDLFAFKAPCNLVETECDEYTAESDFKLNFLYLYVGELKLKI